jgi:uncharacterized protein YlxW (UPF0749 family)
VLRWGRHRSPAAQSRGLAWRLVTPAAFIAAGVLLVTSGVNSGGTDIRAERYGDLADLARQETDRVRELRQEVRTLRQDVEELSAGVDSGALEELQRQVEALEMPAGLTAVEGPGLTVTLDDAPEEVRESAGDQVGNAIVHQQDIQAVVNSLWTGGAEAITLQGQRVISTTGIKCVGNTVLLHGVTYSPPYVVSAIGDPGRLRASVDRSPYIASYLKLRVEQWQLGWDVEDEEQVEAPAFSGSTDLQHARPAEG